MTAAFFMGDSFFQNVLVNPCAARLGWTPTINMYGGSGYVAIGVGTNFNTRLPTLIAAAPDVAVVEGGGNDGGTDGDWTTAVETFYDALRVALPTMPLYVTPGHRMTQARFDILKAIATAHRAIFIDWGDCAEMPRSDGVRWLTGTGKIGAPAGDGNRDVYMSADGIHPSDPEGFAYLGTRLAFAIRPPATGLV